MDAVLPVGVLGEDECTLTLRSDLLETLAHVVELDRLTGRRADVADPFQLLNQRENVVRSDPLAESLQFDHAFTFGPVGCAR